MLGVQGLLCLGMAMFGEYLGTTLTEVKQRPHYLINPRRTQELPPVEPGVEST